MSLVQKADSAPKNASHHCKLLSAMDNCDSQSGEAGDLESTLHS